MKICYIISTCDKYLETRYKYQMETMLKNVNVNDIYYLTSKPNIEKRQFGWYSMDDTQSITWKYIHFIYNMEIPNYDWYIFIDDDTFVFKDRLHNLLKNYDSNESYYIGYENHQIKNEFCVYMSGGAGYAISKLLYSLIVSHLKKIGRDNAYYIRQLKEQFCDDLCIGLWIKDIEKENKINKIHNELFNPILVNNETANKTAITIHKVVTKELYDLFYSIEKSEIIENNDYNEKSYIKDSVFALVSDLKYFNKAKKTIIDLRSKGNWNGEIVLITIDFNLNVNFKDFYNITEIKFPEINKTILLSKIGENGFLRNDGRELNKLNQWEKLHIFDDYFTKWSRVVFLDAGLRVLDDVKYLLELDCKDKLLAPKDGKPWENPEFNCQLSFDNQNVINELKNDFGDHIFKSNYMLNCIWIYDTNILKLCNKNQLIEAMNKYPCSHNNEMGIMNLMFHFKYNLWEPLPKKSSNDKYLFEWCETNYQHITTWRDYCFIKYPLTITFDDT